MVSQSRAEHAARSSSLSFLEGGGDMGALIRAYDWKSSPLGEPARWPQGLKTAVRLLLSTQHPMFIWWGKELIQFYNDAYCRSIGPERHPSALGQRGRECWSEIWELIGWQIEQVMSGGPATWRENQLVPITRHGRREDVYWTYSYGPIDEPTEPNGIGGVLVVCTETTQQVLAEQHMNVAQARWRALFDQTPAFMAILRGPEHTYEYVNSSYIDLVGGRDVIGKSVQQALPEVVDQGFIQILDNAYQSGERHTGSATPILLGRDPPQQRYLDFVYQPIRDFDGQVTGILVQGSDVTDQVALNDALREADARKNEFLAMLAHELRNPLAPIQNASELLARTTPGGSQTQSVISMIKRQVSHLTRLVDDLLDVSRITQGRVELKMEVLDLSAIVNQAIETVQHQLALKEHRLSIVHAGRSLYVRADRARLLQSIANILTNAVKYTDRGGEIEVLLRAERGSAVVEVADNGIGISEELLPKVFDLFVQADRSLDRSQGGLGIGLAIVKRLIDLHGGHVTAASAGTGRGAQFQIHLPAVPAPSAAIGKAPGARLPSRRVLIVDDNVDAADSLSLLLQNEGHEVRTAYSARKAFEVLDTFDAQVVLLDIGLPEIDGYEAARRILALKRPIRLVALTGYGQTGDRQRAAEAGFEEHLLKPVDMAALERILAFTPRLRAPDSV